MILLTLLFTTLAAFADPVLVDDVAPLASQQDCGKRITGARLWRYCIYRYPNASSKVVYFFHGINGDEHEWEQSEKRYLARWTATQRQPPTVVSISFGKAWFLAEKNSSKVSGLHELYVNRILPDIQTNMLGFTASENILLGISMGGLNASQLYFKLPQYYSRAAIICGAMATITPFATKQEIKDYMDRTGADQNYVLLALALSRNYFPTLADWNKHSPVTLAQTLFTPLSPPVYVSNGLKDKFGFHEGNIAFVDSALQAGTSIQYQWFPNGGHCGVDPEPIADFIVAD